MLEKRARFPWNHERFLWKNNYIPERLIYPTYLLIQKRRIRIHWKKKHLLFFMFHKYLIPCLSQRNLIPLLPLNHRTPYCTCKKEIAVYRGVWRGKLQFSCWNTRHLPINWKTQNNLESVRQIESKMVTPISEETETFPQTEEPKLKQPV